MSRVGSHYCKTCRRQVSTREYSYGGIKNIFHFFSHLIGLAILAVVAAFICVAFPPAIAIAAPYVLWKLFTPSYYAFRCDFCGQILA